MYHETESAGQKERLEEGKRESEVGAQSAKQPAIQSSIQTSRQTTSWLLFSLQVNEVIGPLISMYLTDTPCKGGKKRENICF